MVKRKYGYKPFKEDKRDYKLRTTNPTIYATLPPKVDLRSFVPEVLNQEDFNSCTANALSIAMRITRRIQNLPDMRTSRLFIYYNERLLEGDVDQDNGAELRDGAKVIASYGAPNEDIWQYVDTNLYLEPIKQAYETAVQNEAKTYLQVEQTLNEMKLCLHEGYPFVFGAILFPEFESDAVAANGMVPMPTGNEQPIGGHAITCVGYNDSKKVWIVLNSWGDQWGDHGYCYFPYDYLTNPNLCLELWTIRSIAPTDPARKWVIPIVPPEENGDDNSVSIAGNLNVSSNVSISVTKK